MRKVSVIIPGLFLAIALMSSCADPAEKAALQGVDSVAQVVDSAEKVLLSVNMDSLKWRNGLYKQYASAIEENYDAIKTDESWPYICLYRNCKKSFSLLIDGYPNFKAEIDSSRAQLENLRHDIRKDLLKKEEITSFVMLEKQNANELLERIRFRVNNAMMEELNFDTVHPKIVGFVDAVKSK